MRRAEKLSKQTRAAPVDASSGSAALCAAIGFLGHSAPDGLAAAPVSEFWRWALDNWSLARVPKVRGICPAGGAARI